MVFLPVCIHTTRHVLEFEYILSVLVLICLIYLFSANLISMHQDQNLEMAWNFGKVPGGDPLLVICLTRCSLHSDQLL